MQYWENGKITIDEVFKKDQEMLTTWYTEHAVDFINKNKNESLYADDLGYGDVSCYNIVS